MIISAAAAGDEMITGQAPRTSQDPTQRYDAGTGPSTLGLIAGAPILLLLDIIIC